MISTQSILSAKSSDTEYLKGFWEMQVMFVQKMMSDNIQLVKHIISVPSIRFPLLYPCWKSDKISPYSSIVFF